MVKGKDTIAVMFRSHLLVYFDTSANAKYYTAIAKRSHAYLIECQALICGDGRDDRPFEVLLDIPEPSKL